VEILTAEEAARIIPPPIALNYDPAEHSPVPQPEPGLTGDTVAAIFEGAA
jgi:hypothetical protein